MNQKKNDTGEYNIINFIEEHVVENGKIHTHTSMHNPKAAYFIKSTELDMFYDLYQSYIDSGNELHLTEKRQEFFPITIDIDFKYDLETHERKHNEEHIKKITELYINEICNIFNFALI